MSLDDCLDTLHQERHIRVAQLMPEVAAVLGECLEVLLDVGAPMDLVSRCQMLQYIARHVSDSPLKGEEGSDG